MSRPSFPRDVANRAVADRCRESEARNQVAHGLAFAVGPIGNQRGSLGERGWVIEQPDPKGRKRHELGIRTCVGAAHLEEPLEPHIGKERGEMIGPIVEGRIFARKPIETAGNEILERRAGNINVAAVAVDEIHRHIERVVDIALEPHASLEHEGKIAGAVGVGVAPDLGAIGFEAVRLADSKG